MISATLDTEKFPSTQMATSSSGFGGFYKRRRQEKILPPLAGDLPFRFETMHHSHLWVPHSCRRLLATGACPERSRRVRTIFTRVPVLTFESSRQKTRISAIPGFALRRTLQTCAHPLAKGGREG